MSEVTSIEWPIQLVASDRRLPPSEAAMVCRLWFIWAMPATCENCAIWATICVLSTGLNGSWVVSCVVISFRKSFWVIAPAGLAALAADAAPPIGVVAGTLWALLIVSRMLVIGRASMYQG